MRAKVAAVGVSSDCGRAIELVVNRFFLLMKGGGSCLNVAYAHDRVETQQPEQNTTKGDAIAAWYNTIRNKPRLDKNPDEYLAIGIDGKGRLMELVAIRDEDVDFLICQAVISPRDNAKRELGIYRKER